MSEKFNSLQRQRKINARQRVKIKELESHLAVMVEALKEGLERTECDEFQDLQAIFKNALHCPPIHHFIKLSEARQRVIEMAKNWEKNTTWKNTDLLMALKALSEIEGKE